MLRIPLESWPQVDLSTLDGARRERAEGRALAVRLYEQGIPHPQIFAKTGIRRQQLSRLMERCQRVAADGRVYGYRALIQGVRIVGYTRIAPVKHSRGEGSAGCAGALTQLLARFPELDGYIREEFLTVRPKRKEQEVRITVAKLHGKVIAWLQARGLAKDEWPLNTQNEGLETLRRYCNSLISCDEQRWLSARAGSNAVMRSSIGKGIAPVFTPLRPFTAVQLDFHKVDAASIISVTNSHGVDIDVPLPRWHIGLLIEERLELILGTVIALERTPSSDSVLETLECALVPVPEQAKSCALAIGMSGKIFPNQVFEQLRGQGFGILRIDNGWSNTAIDVIDNVINVVGCAVDFGPVRAWWTRHTIERVFGQMTRSALQCSPSTYGAGPADSRRKNPDQAAVRLKIRLSDLVLALEQVIAEHNNARTESIGMGGPLPSLIAAMNNPNSLFIPSPIPDINRDMSDELALIMYKTINVVVRGNRSKGERPYVKIGRWRYTNPRISSDFSLIGSILKAYCSIRDARIVHVTNQSNAEDLGRLVPPARWAHTHVSFRMRGLWYRAGEPMRREERRAAGAYAWLPTEVTGSETYEPTIQDEPTSLEALELAKYEVQQRRQRKQTEKEGVSDTSPGSKHGNEVSINGGLFNLDAPLQITQAYTEE